jgi:C_GCAxxG_C_C family probable redox protein
VKGHAERALALHSEKFNCAQAVFAAFAPELGIREEDAFKAAAGFGGGMGRLQETCGAVTGALMVLGHRHGMVRPGETAAKEETYGEVQKFVRRFREIHGTSNCRELLRCDLNTPEGLAYYNEKNLSANVCTECIRSACVLLEAENARRAGGD